MDRLQCLRAGVGIALIGCGAAHGGGVATQSGASSGGDAATQPPAQLSPPHVVTPCDKLAAVGTWENITPAGIDLSTYGAVGVTFNPSDSSNVYLGTTKSGLHKSTDCGATWSHLDTGTLAADIDKGATLALLDPIDPKVLYTFSLYGTNGFFKSTNGGVDFTQILSPTITKYAPYGGFVGGYAMDPGNHLHLLVTWHQVCEAPYTSACFAETKDGGATWTMRNGNPSWNGGEGAAMQFLDSKTWLFSSASNGMWRTTDEGMTWTQVPGATISHGVGQLYHSPNGPYFLGSANGVLYSADGATWSLVPNSGNLIAGVVGDGTTVWASAAFPYNPGAHPPPFQPYVSALESAPMMWTTFGSPQMTSGGFLAYDPDHHLLYSANYWEGLWRVVVK